MDIFCLGWWGLVVLGILWLVQGCFIMWYMRKQVKVGSKTYTGFEVLQLVGESFDDATDKNAAVEYAANLHKLLLVSGIVFGTAIVAVFVPFFIWYFKNLRHIVYKSAWWYILGVIVVFGLEYGVMSLPLLYVETPAFKLQTYELEFMETELGYDVVPDSTIVQKSEKALELGTALAGINLGACVLVAMMFALSLHVAQKKGAKPANGFGLDPLVQRTKN